MEANRKALEVVGQQDSNMEVDSHHTTDMRIPGMVEEEPLLGETSDLCLMQETETMQLESSHWTLS